jgi:hypothetical protein
MPNPNQNRRSASRQQTQDSRFDGVAFHVAQRERSRKIKLHQETEKATSKGDAVVLTQAGLPDMRFAEDKSKFSRDPRRRRRISDNQPDRRFLENRPDLLEVRRQRGEDRANFIFTDDMMDQDVNEISQELAEAGGD